MEESKPIPATACVGFRPIDTAGGALRQRTFDLIRDSFLTSFQDYVVADDSPYNSGDAFNRSLAKNNAARHSAVRDPDPDGVLVFADADTYVPWIQVALAVDAVRTKLADIALAHDGTALYLSHGVVRGMGEGGIVGPFPGGVFAIRRSVFEAVGGWDEKFCGWGHEDLCFLNAATRIFGYNLMLSNHPQVGPVYKFDMLYPRLSHEWDLLQADSEEARLYQKNTRRRDAYFALPDGDQDAYWALRDKDIT